MQIIINVIDEIRGDYGSPEGAPTFQGHHRNRHAFSTEGSINIKDAPKLNLINNGNHFFMFLMKSGAIMGIQRGSCFPGAPQEQVCIFYYKCFKRY